MAKTQKPKLTVVKDDPKPDDQDTTADDLESIVPEAFTGRWKRMFIDLVQEVIAIRQSATPADLSMIETAVASAMGEQECRDFAAEARDDGDRTDYLTMTRLGITHSRQKSAALSALKLVGDKSRISADRRKGFAATNDSVVSGATGGRSSRWKDLL